MTTVQTENVLAIVQAGGAGGRMDVLTLERAKPALSFAGSYQLIDFPLSNLVNSRIDDVWLSVQYQASALEEQVLNGRPWDLDRTGGGLRLLVPQEGPGRWTRRGSPRATPMSCSGSRPDQERRTGPGHRDERRPRLPPRLPRGHRHPPEEEAEVTIVTTDLAEIFGEDARDARGRRGEPARSGRPRSPTSPRRRASTTVATEVFVYEPDALIKVLEELHHVQSDEPHEGDDGRGRLRARRLRRPAAAALRRARQGLRPPPRGLLARPRPAAPLPERAPRAAADADSECSAGTGPSGPSSRSASRPRCSRVPASRRPAQLRLRRGRHRRPEASSVRVSWSRPAPRSWRA